MHSSSVVETAARILKEYALCERCLGRCFGLLSTGITNEERGRAVIITMMLELSRRIFESGRGCSLLDKLREVYTSDGRLRDPDKCFICGGVTSRVKMAAQKIAEAVKGYEFATFRVGITLPARLVEAEDEIRRRFFVKFGESIKSELSREIGKEVSRLIGASASRNPDIDVTYNVASENIEVIPRPLYLRGFYVKLDSSLGSKEVEEAIGKTAAEFYRAETFKLHTVGMEVEGLKVLGFGREFVLELIRPVRRFTDPNVVRKEVNRKSSGLLYIRSLGFAGREAVAAVKRPEKTIVSYLILAKGTDVSKEEVEEAERVRRVVIKRGTRKLERRIFDLKIKRWNETILIFLRCQGGVNPKKFVEGGRSYEPSLGDLFGGKISYLEHIVIEARGE